MPIPKPNKGEKENNFMSRCIGFVTGEGRDQKQAVAICSSQWKGGKTMKTAEELTNQEDALLKFLSSDKAAAVIKEVAEGGHNSLVEIKKIDEDEQLVFGWFSVVEQNGELIKDHEGDYIEPIQLEKAAYRYVLDARIAGDSHIRKGVGQLVESIVFTKDKQEALGIDLGYVGWWGGFHIDDDEVWKKIKKGEYLMFSIGGTGQRVPKEV